MNEKHKFAFLSLISTIVFSSYYLIIGLLSNSWWLLTLGMYNLILSIVRFVVLRLKIKENSVRKFTGWMLMLLTFPLVGTVILSVVRDRGIKLHMIVMIAIAAYAFTRISIATINLIKSRKTNSETIKSLRNIAFSDALVSIFALQRSMLVSFEGMTEPEIVIMNATLGAAICIIVFLLGLNLLLHNPKQISNT